MVSNMLALAFGKMVLHLALPLNSMTGLLLINAKEEWSLVIQLLAPI